MNNISQTTISIVFSSMKMFELRLKFHWSLFPRVQSTIFQHLFRYWLGAVQATSHYLNQWWLVYRCIYASLGLNELNAELCFFKNYEYVIIFHDNTWHFLNKCWLSSMMAYGITWCQGFDRLQIDSGTISKHCHIYWWILPFSIWFGLAENNLIWIISMWLLIVSRLLFYSSNLIEI